MKVFFNFFGAISGVALLAVAVSGHARELFGITPFHHMVLGLSAALLSTAVHCLIFAIFTGAGKDTRELVQDLSLNQKHIQSVKDFRKQAFPPALYAIFTLLLTACVGGALSRLPSLKLLHIFLGWFSCLYNWRVFVLESRLVSLNQAFLERVNLEASHLSLSPPLSILESTVEHYDWEAHVYALGRFLCFLGYNVWLPFIYLRFVIGYFRTPVWPFLALSLLCLLTGYYLRWRYYSFRPERWREA